MIFPRRFAFANALLLVAAILSACGAAASTLDEPTPTPLPPAPEVERPTYTVELGTIENPLEVNGRVTPVDYQTLAFARSGLVATVSVERGQQVQEGDTLAELQQDEELEALALAEDGVTQAQRDLDSAERQRTKRIEQAQLDLADAREALKRVLPGGVNDPIRKAQQDLEAAQRAAGDQNASGSESKTQAEYDLLRASETLSDTQNLVSEAYWNNDHAQRYGTDPKQPYIEVTGADGKVTRKPNYLTDEQKEAYAKAYLDAQRQLRDAERAVVAAQRALDKARENEIVGNDDANEKVIEAQRVLDEMINGNGNTELEAAQKAVKSAQLALEEAQAETLNSAIKAVEDAQRALDKARKKVEDGKIVAPRAGEIISLSIGQGDSVQANDFVIEVADTSRLEVGADLGGEQMRQLQEGQPAEISLLSRPDVLMPAFIRQMPEPYGSGSSGNVQSKDTRTLFDITDFKGQELKSGQNVKIRIVLERKENALILPPDAIRSFEGRRFVIIRTEEGDRRQTVKLGIQTDDLVEILEGVAEGDVIVGQ